MKYQIEIVNRTFFWVDADSVEEAEDIAVDWATAWTQPDGAVVDSKGGIEIGDTATVDAAGFLRWRDD